MHLGLFLNFLFSSISLAIHALMPHGLIIEALRCVFISGKVFLTLTTAHTCTPALAVFRIFLATLVDVLGW